MTDLEKYEALEVGTRAIFGPESATAIALRELIAMVRTERERLENFKSSRPWIERRQGCIMRDMRNKMRDWEYLAHEQMELRRKAERELATIRALKGEK